MLEKENKFNDKKYLTDVNNLKLENDRLRLQLGSNYERFQNESDLTIERLRESQEDSLRALEEKYLIQLNDIKDIHSMEVMKLNNDLLKFRNDLKFARLDYQELVSKSDVGDKMESLHDLYLGEIQSLSQ